MLGLLRKNSRHWLVVSLVAMAVIGMSFFFGYSFSDKGGEGWAAKVDGDIIKMQHFIARYKNVLEYYRTQMKGAFDEKLLQSMNVKYQVLSGMVQRKIIAKEAQSNGLGISRLELKDSLSGLTFFQKNGKFNMDYYKGFLAYNKYTPKEFENIQREDMLMDKLRDIVVDSSKVADEEVLVAYKLEHDKVKLSYAKLDKSKIKIKVSPEQISDFLKSDKGLKEVKDYYSNNNDEFIKKEQIRARHILIKSSKNDSEKIRNEKRKKIEGLLAVVTKDNFAEMAKKNSEDGSASKGGDLGYFGKGRMVKPFEEVAFSLKKGEISDIVETQFGYHIILVEDKKPESVVSFENAKNDIARKIIKKDLLSKKINSLVAEEIKSNNLEKTAKKEVFTKIKSTKEISRKNDSLGIPGSSSTDVLWAFNLKKGHINKRDISGETYLFTVTDINKSSIKTGTKEFDDYKEKYLSQRGTKEFVALTEKYRKNWADRVFFSRAINK